VRSEGLSISVLEWVRTKALILMRQPVVTNVLAELEEIETEFWMYKYKRYDTTTAFSFYFATLCVSAVHAVGRCLSVCPTCSCIVSKRLKIIVELLSFLKSSDVAQLQEKPISGAWNTQGWGKFATFDWNRRCLSRKQYEIDQ